ncbi:hypothetical protein MKZ38_009435 [Zalerion maritima]|uniref:Uncharacterized protein n=1 Tax=Zalerion maritima TaxID=339359 RepID=A0AAD5RGD4_9PEZI|nr:hypothetical protein MKZ38_009435 [Zalerion maritima]
MFSISASVQVAIDKAFTLENACLCCRTDVLQSRERYLSIELEKCRAHLDANNDDRENDDCSNKDGDIAHTAGDNGAPKCCPHKGCERNKPFATGQRLRRHFQQRKFPFLAWSTEITANASNADVECEEHKDASATKTTYAKQICKELLERVNKELNRSLAESEDLSEGVENGGRTRTWDAAAMGSRSSATQRAKLDSVEVTTTECPPTQRIDDTPAARPSMQPTTVLTTLPEEVVPVAIDNISNISTQAFFPGSMEQAGDFDNLLNFDPPLLSVFNFPPQVSQLQWLPEDHGTRH